MITRTLPFDQLKNLVTSDEVRAFCQSQRGGIVRITIEEIAEPRTMAQCRHVNSHVQQLAEFSGYSFQEMKELVKEEAMASGYPIEYENGKPVKNCFGRDKGISEANATKEQASMLIEACHRLAAEMGVVLREF